MPESHSSVVCLSLYECNRTELLPRREATDFVLPFVAEHEDHHLMIYVGVVAEAADRSATGDRKHLVCSLRLLREWGQRADLRWRWLLPMHLDPEFACVALMLFILDVDSAQRAVVL